MHSFLPPPSFPIFLDSSSWIWKQPLPTVWESLRPIRSLFSSLKFFFFPLWGWWIINVFEIVSEATLSREWFPWPGTVWLPDGAPSHSPLLPRPGSSARSAGSAAVQPGLIASAVLQMQVLLSFSCPGPWASLEVPAAVRELGRDRKEEEGFMRCLGIFAETCKMSAGGGRGLCSVMR